MKSKTYSMFYRKVRGENKMNKELLNEIENILNDDNLSAPEKREKLNILEKENAQDVFIKTHLCAVCSNLDIEIWVKYK